VNLDQVAAAIKCPPANVTANWPAIEICLKDLGCWSRNAVIAALATIAVETAYKFQPIREMGGETYLRSKKYFPFYGRGFAQLTWENNYRHYGEKLGIDLVSDPDRALNPTVAADLFAIFFHERHIRSAADAGKWTHVREIWNGGHNGLPEFLQLVSKLEGVIPNED
jgi:Chitinase class I